MPDKQVGCAVAMPGKGLHNAFCCLLLILLCGASCKGSGTIKGDTVYYLDAHKRSIVQPIEPKDFPMEGPKFVQIEVTKIVNPKMHSLTFEVSYQSKEGDVKTNLGSFSPFPADNPGTFIVPTQGKVKNRGAIILSLVIPDKIDPGDTVEVTVKKMTLRKD
jgi:hypothetical protein